ncbi:Ribose import ATP-binding protein RbsA [subsurface metagenome]|jgi:ABC-type sugar transport system ATPase subunit
MKDSNNSILKIHCITKIFPGVKALDSVSLSFEKEKVHAIIGENGAGKSSMIKVITGIYQPEEGNIFLEDKKLFLKSVFDARKKGIAAVYQESECVPNMNVAENIFLGNWNHFAKRKLINKKSLEEKTKKLLEKYKLNHININALANSLSASEKKWIDILRVVYLNPKIIIFDEPTAAFSNIEIEKLFAIIRSLKKEGKTILYISHHLEEVFEISDTVTVLKDGKLVNKVNSSETNRNIAIKMMVGRELKAIYPERRTLSSVNRKILTVEKLSSKKLSLSNISFDLYDGEILGIFGLEGQGQFNLIRCLFGLYPIEEGKIYFDNKEIQLKSPIEAVKKRIAFLSEKRDEEGLCLNQPVKHNISLANLGSEEIQKTGFISNCKENKIVKDLVDKVRILAPSIMANVETLSGGNRQKVVISKWIASHAKLYLFEEPTAGIDVESRMGIYKLLRKFANEGKGIIVLSSDMTEIMGISDRIVILHAGKIVKIFDKTKEKITEEKLCAASITPV